MRRFRHEIEIGGRVLIASRVAGRPQRRLTAEK
jgi:hypothetical protein